MFCITYNGLASSYSIKGVTFKRGTQRYVCLDNHADRALYNAVLFNPEFDVKDVSTCTEGESVPTPAAASVVEVDSTPTHAPLESWSDQEIFPLKKTEQPKPLQATSKRGKRR